MEIDCVNESSVEYAAAIEYEHGHCDAEHARDATMADRRLMC